MVPERARGQWFDANRKPAFNSSAGAKALETMREMLKYAPPGVTSYANDECTVALIQGIAAMGLQWVSRAAPRRCLPPSPIRPLPR